MVFWADFKFVLRHFSSRTRLEGSWGPIWPESDRKSAELKSNFQFPSQPTTKVFEFGHGRTGDRLSVRQLGSAKRAPTTLKDPAGNLRFRTRFGPKAGTNQTPNTRHGAHRLAHNDSERFWADFGVFRRGSETFKLRDRSPDARVRLLPRPRK